MYQDTSGGRPDSCETQAYQQNPSCFEVRDTIAAFEHIQTSISGGQGYPSITSAAIRMQTWSTAS